MHGIKSEFNRVMPNNDHKINVKKINQKFYNFLLVKTEIYQRNYIIFIRLSNLKKIQQTDIIDERKYHELLVENRI